MAYKIGIILYNDRIKKSIVKKKNLKKRSKCTRFNLSKQWPERLTKSQQIIKYWLIKLKEKVLIK